MIWHFEFSFSAYLSLFYLVAMDLSLMTVLMLVYLSDCNCLYQEKTSRFNSLQLAKSVSKVMLQDISRIAENQQGRTRTRHRRAIGLCGLSESDVLEMNPVSSCGNQLGSPASKHAGRQLKTPKNVFLTDLNFYPNM